MPVAAWIWLGLAVLFGIIEGATAGLVSVWFAGGAVSAFFSALFGGNCILQIAIFAFVSAILLACLRPLSHRKLRVNPTATNADRILGRAAVVTEPIDNLKATGAVRIDGVEWSARSSGGQAIAGGAVVKILKIDGVKVVVDPAEAPAGV